MATSGHFYWPPMGSSDWPLTGLDMVGLPDLALRETADLL